MATSGLASLFASRFRFVEKVSNKLSNFLYWGGILRLLMEGYLEITIATMLNCVRNNREDRSLSIIFSNVFSILMIALLVTLPVFILFYYWNRRKDWATEEFEKKWGAPFEGLECSPTMPMTENEIRSINA